MSAAKGSWPLPVTPKKRDRQVNSGQASDVVVEWWVFNKICWKFFLSGNPGISCDNIIYIFFLKHVSSW